MSHAVGIVLLAMAGVVAPTASVAEVVDITWSAEVR
jgi:hypothetical protein